MFLPGPGWVVGLEDLFYYLHAAVPVVDGEDWELLWRFPIQLVEQLVAEADV